MNSLSKNNIESFAVNVLYCALYEIDRLKLTSEYEDRVVYIDTKEINMVNFALSEKDKMKLVTYGYLATKQYLLGKGLKSKTPTNGDDDDSLTPFEELLLPKIEEILPERETIPPPSENKVEPTAPLNVSENND